MGKEVPRATFTRIDRANYRAKVGQCLDVLAQLLDQRRFAPYSPMTGIELELVLVGTDLRPAMCNREILAGIGDPSYQAELGQFNLELNCAPRLLAGTGLDQYRDDLLHRLSIVDMHAGKVEARSVMIGTLPTLTPGDAVLRNLSANPRYLALNDEIVAARGEFIALDIRGAERLRAANDSIAPEAACTSVQFHLQVTPEDFARYWNASQAIAGAQLAVGANAPFLFGRSLWAETRIALFEQATDTRSEQVKAQGARPRVWFGERWIDSISDLFAENLRYFPPLLPILTDEDPQAVLAGGGVPDLPELRLHNGTVYRWNRPVYDVRDGRPHLRVENRVLPAGPTVVDVLANAALYYGLVRELVEQDTPLWTLMPFGQAAANFHAAARDGIGATQSWPGLGELPAVRLVREHLLPVAAAGLDRLGVAARVRDRLLGVIDGRCAAGRNGDTWQRATVRRLERDLGLPRPDALAEMLRRYVDLAAGNEPVHTWPLG